MKIGIIGAGRMGSALVEGFIVAGVKPGDIWVNEKDEARAAEVRKRGVKMVSKKEFLKCDVVFLVVKPKEVQEALGDFPRDFQKSFVSSVAGVRLETFKVLEKAKLFRIMPNIFCRWGEGAIALCAEGADEKSTAEVERVLSRLGKVVRVDEELMDVVTALSGSGPAFFSLLLEAAVDEAGRLGLPRRTALILAAQTLRGLGTAVEGGESPDEIIQKVASPGGTTEAGLQILAPASEIVRKAIKRAFERSGQLCSKK